MLNKRGGYVFTLEALIVSLLFLTAFYIVYDSSNYNFVTSMEMKKDTEKYHKALLIIDYFIKKYQFPGSYNEDYMQNFANYIKLKSFDPINNFSNETVYFIVQNSSYDYYYPNNITNLKTLYIKNIVIYSNTYNNISHPNINYENRISFKETLYIPKITGITYGNSVTLYGEEGAKIFFKFNGTIKSINISAPAVLSINGYLYKVTNDTNITPLIYTNDINEIDILNCSNVIKITLTTENNSKFYYVTFVPRTIIFYVRL